jgi:hypothetical protein
MPPTPGRTRVVAHRLKHDAMRLDTIRQDAAVTVAAILPDLTEDQQEQIITDWVQRQLAKAPPLSPATRDRLAALLSAPGADEAA